VLVRKVRDAMKPRRIEMRPATATKTIEPKTGIEPAEGGPRIRAVPAEPGASQYARL